MTRGSLGLVHGVWIHCAGRVEIKMFAKITGELQWWTGEIGYTRRLKRQLLGTPHGQQGSLAVTRRAFSSLHQAHFRKIPTFNDSKPDPPSPESIVASQPTSQRPKYLPTHPPTTHSYQHSLQQPITRGMMEKTARLALFFQLGCNKNTRGWGS